jgi:hypothetical protein
MYTVALPGYVVNVALCPDLAGDKEARRDKTMGAAQGGPPRQVGLGIRSIRVIRFGLFGFVKFRVLKNENRNF